ncbi:MAG: hypothetical protein IJC52_01900 [Clostridia bacterium]|nr:hypothetical protein [Clostridia bacterium]
MNKDLLLDAIGMVDEQTLREAADIKRTKRVTGCVTAVMILLAVMALGGTLWIASYIIKEDVHPYTVEMLANHVANSNTVTVYPDGNVANSYTVYIPSDLSQALRLNEWTPDKETDLAEQEERLSLRFGRTTLTFYDHYVTAEMHDWGLYAGTFAVPEGLWQEVAKTLTP